MKKPDMPIPTYDGGLFHWSGNSGVADASDLGLNAGIAPGRQVWSDACDVGFIVKGRREERLFTLVGEDRHEGELVGWRFRDEAGYQLLVVND